MESNFCVCCLSAWAENKQSESASVREFHSFHALDFHSLAKITIIILFQRKYLVSSLTREESESPLAPAHETQKYKNQPAGKSESSKNSLLCKMYAVFRVNVCAPIRFEYTSLCPDMWFTSTIHPFCAHRAGKRSPEKRINIFMQNEKLSAVSLRLKQIKLFNSSFVSFPTPLCVACTNSIRVRLLFIQLFMAKRRTFGANRKIQRGKLNYDGCVAAPTARSINFSRREKWKQQIDMECNELNDIILWNVCTASAPAALSIDDAQ